MKHQWQVTPSKGGRKRDAEVIAWVEAFRQRHDRSPTIPEVQAVFATISKATAWRYATAA
jgi:hypothetical protein